LTMLGIGVVLIIGILMLVAGFVAKKRWLMLLSIVPLVISIFQLVILFGFGR
jgi:hypothetical protein